MTRKEWWCMWAGVCLMAALVGAFIHSLFIVVYNAVLLGVYIALYNYEKNKEN